MEAINPREQLHFPMPVESVSSSMTNIPCLFELIFATNALYAISVYRSLLTEIAYNNKLPCKLVLPNVTKLNKQDKQEICKGRRLRRRPAIPATGGACMQAYCQLWSDYMVTHDCLTTHYL